MQVTEVRLRKVKSDSNMKAYGSITFDDCFVVKNVKVIERKDKPLLVVMPESPRGRNGRKSDVAHPINQETRDMITEAVLKQYEITPEPEDLPTTEGTPVEE